MKLVAYEHFANDCQNKYLSASTCRDSMQAENIKQIFQKDSHAKVFVYAGHSHIINQKKKNWTFMGYYLQNGLPTKRIYTIEQTKFMKDNGTFRDNINEHFSLNKPTLLINNKFDDIKNRYLNAYIIHPRKKEFAYWYFERNEICNTKYDLIPPKAAFYIEIYPRIKVFKKKYFPVFKSKIADIPQTYIYLPKGEYEFVYKDKDNRILI